MQEEYSTSAAPPTSRTTGGVFHRSFPLIVLLQLATCCAALIACVDGLALGRLLDLPEWARFAWPAIIGALLSGGLVGSLVGLGQIGKWRSTIQGFCVGALSGLTIFCIYVAPAPVERIVAAAAMIVLSTVMVRLRAA